MDADPRRVMLRRAGLAALVLAVAMLAWARPLDDRAISRAEAGLTRALLAFAAARALNGVISVLQGTEVSAGVGVGVKTAPGQILDPVNDLVEQFSTLMLAATVAFAAQIVLMQIGAGWLVSLALTVVVAAWALGWWRGRAPPGWLSRLLVLLLLLRFALPAAHLASDALYRAFLHERQTAAQQGLGQASGALGAQPGVDGGGADAPGGKAVPWWNLRERYEAVRAAAERAVGHVIELAVIFLLSTLVLPLGLLWALVLLVRHGLLPGLLSEK